MKNTMYGVMLGVAVVLTGCATGGTAALQNESQSTLSNKLVAGQTTEAEVVSMYGQPASIRNSKTGKTYVYVYTESKSGNVFRALDAQDANTIASGAMLGGMAGGVKGGVVGAGSMIAVDRVGGAMNKKDDGVKKSLIVRFNKRGVVSSFSLH